MAGVSRVPRSVPLPSPAVSFGPDVLDRLGRLAVRVSSQRGREGAGSARLMGVGAEFVGYRPYRPGADLRQLDWNLYARLRRPFVRTTRREASEHWCVLLDTSASMGVGVPGKLQCAAELAVALAVIGSRGGAVVDLLPSEGAAAVRVRRRAGLGGWIRQVERLRAAGERGLAALLERPRALRSAGRVFLVGDFLDLEPQRVLGLQRRGRELACAQVLAPDELAPRERGAVRWMDAETGAALWCAVDRRVRADYEAALSEDLERLGAVCARHRIGYGCWASTTPFETMALALVS